MNGAGRRTPVLYLAPWVDYGGTDKGTIDWFRWLDRDRFAPSLITTQPSLNRRLAEIEPYAEEVWALPDLMAGADMPPFIIDFVHSRGIELVHVMNSRLGFDLLPDLGCLPRAPKVVVQLHVEEPDRSGYVRYVTTRYGNLVDGFSISTSYVADAAAGYGISRDRIRVIHTGVDADDEFAPSRWEPVAELAADRVHILFPGRIVQQKDPLLMLDVAAALRDSEPGFQVHMVGDGELEEAVRRGIADRGLGEHVAIHPPTRRLQGWYAACDLMLMTSEFEGVPYVVYEAMAMGLPVVSPALPGNVELLGDSPGGLVEPRDDVVGYVRALAPLIEDSARRAEIADRARERVRERFSLGRMAAEHAELYDELLAERATQPEPEEPAPEAAAARGAPIRLRRSLHGTPLVSVIVPCFNHGRFLRDCLEAIRAQTYPGVETIVVDDASTDSETVAVIEALESEPGAQVVRLEENGGPSRARNVALDRASGRYVLPVDADNLLLPDAIERLVEQLRTAPEDVGFVYPNLQYFGNREDYFEPPDWDPHELLHGNYCDVCSLFDADVFGAERFDESIRLGHEDWEFVLRLAERGVRGERAHGPTVRYRKLGFNRSDSVEYGATPFHEAVRRMAGLSARHAELKARWAPALSLIALEPVETGGEQAATLLRRLAEQSCTDFELVLRSEGELAAHFRAPALRRIPAALARSPAHALQGAVSVARGRCLAITAGTGSDLLADGAFVEKVLRSLAALRSGPVGSAALVLAESGVPGAIRMAPLGESAAVGPPHALVLGPEADERLPRPAVAWGAAPIEALVHASVAAGLSPQWRHAPGRVPADSGEQRAEAVPERPAGTDHPPVLPSAPAGCVPRWRHAAAWIPPQSQLLCRHRRLDGAGWVISLDRDPPDGYELDYELGCVRQFSLAGTAELLALPGEQYATRPRGSWEPPPPGGRALGYVEQAAFPLLEPLILARHRTSGARTLVCGEADHLMAAVDALGTLGFVEAFPPNPRFAQRTRSPFGLVGLTKSVDGRARRHRHAAGERAAGELVGELGALLAVRQPGAIPLWLVDGRAHTPGHRPHPSRPSPAAAARWTLAPLGWRGFAEPLPKARAAARRSLSAAAALAVRGDGQRPPADGPPAGWLLGERLGATVSLYAAYHPVTADQVLTTSALEATDMGYVAPELLGHLLREAPVTGTLERRLVPVPWASRFGLEARVSGG